MAAVVPSIESAAAGAKGHVREFLTGPAKKLLIDGKWVAAKSGKTFETINPANEEVLGLVAEGDKADVDEAVKAARKAFETGKWPSMGPHQRARYLFKIAEMIEGHADELAELITLDNGKPIAESVIEVNRTAETFRYYARLGDQDFTARPIRPIPRCSTTRCASRLASAGRSFRGIARSRMSWKSRPRWLSATRWC